MNIPPYINQPFNVPYPYGQVLGQGQIPVLGQSQDH